MKRFTKIFLVVLAVALVFGAIAMNASAAENVTGLYTNRKDAFSYAPGENKTSGFGWDGITNAAKSNAVFTIGETDPSIEDNKYLYVVCDQSSNLRGNAYFGTGYGGKNFGNKTRPTLKDGVVTDNNSVTKFPYLITDFDIMSPTGKILGMSIGVEVRTFKAGDTGIDQVWITTADGKVVTQSPIQIFCNDKGENVVAWADDLEGGYVINPYEWTRVSFILEGVANPDPMGTPTVNGYLYINGELHSARYGAYPTWGFEGDKPVLSWDEVRINFAAGAAADASVAVDNLWFRTTGLSYDKNAGAAGNMQQLLKGEITMDEWDGNMYDAEARPFGTAIAQVGDVKFDSFAKALAAVEEGGEIELLKDIKGSVFADKEVKIITNGFTVDVEADKEALLGAKVDEDGNVVVESVEGKFVYVEWDNCYCEGDGHFDDEGNVDPAYHPLFNEIEELYIYSSYYEAYNPTFEGVVNGENVVLTGWEVNGEILPVDAIVTAEDVEAGFISITPIYSKYVTVTWEDANGNVIGTSQALQGTVAEVPADLKGETVIEGFLKARPSAWLDLNVPADATEFTVKADPAAAPEIYADVDFLLSIKPQDNVNIVVYVPVAAEGIEYVDFIINGSNNRFASASTVKINGKTYRGGQGWLGTDVVLAGNTAAEVKFTYGGVQYSNKVTFDIADYANAILDIEGYSEAAKDFAVNLANYYWVIANVRGKAADAIAQDFKAIVDNNTSRVITIDPATAKKAEASEYIKSVQLAVGSYNNTYTITFTDEAAAVLGATSIVKEKVSLRQLNAIEIKAGETTYVFTIENYVAALYEANADATSQAVIMAIYGYTTAHKAYAVGFYA